MPDVVDEARRHLDTLRLEPDSKRPDIPPAIPQAILPILRRVVQQSQAFKTIIRVPIKGRAKDGNEDAGKKRRREESQRADSTARYQERQVMKDKLDEQGRLSSAAQFVSNDALIGTNMWNRTLQINRLIKMAKEAAVDEKDRSRMQMRQEAMGHWEKLFAFCKCNGSD
jgi:hypothetical protein